jgi:hypothetical protein
MLLTKRESILEADQKHGINELWRRVRVRKAHDCCECGSDIDAGSFAYARSSACAPGPIGRPFYDEYLCEGCDWRAEVDV